MKKCLPLVISVCLMLSMVSVAFAEPVTLSYNDWSYVDEGWKDCYTALFAQFDELYGSEIDLQVGGNAFADTLNNLLIQAAGGNPPDIAKIKTEWLPQFLAMGVLADLTPYLPEEMESDFYSGTLDAYRYNGGLYAIPYFSQSYAVFYNKDLLEQAGITELPKTFDELIEAAYKVSALGSDENGNTIYGLGLPANGTTNGDGYNVFPWLWANGGAFKDENGQISLYSEANLEAFTQIQKIYVDGVSPVGLTFYEMRTLFGTGNLGFYWDLMSQTSSFTLSSVLGEEYLDHIGAFIIPGAEEGDGVSYSTESIFVIFNTCKNPEIAMKVIDYLSGTQGQQILSEYGRGKMSGRASVMDLIYKDTTDEITKAYIGAMAVCRPMPFTDAAFMEADLAIGRAIVRLAMNEEVDTVIKELQAEVEEIYAAAN